MKEAKRSENKDLIQISSSIQYQLMWDVANKKLSLHPKNSNQVLAEAKFAFDVADGYGILSDIVVSPEQVKVEELANDNKRGDDEINQARVNFIIDETCQYIQKKCTKDSELFAVIPKSFCERFDDNESYDRDADRLMILHEPNEKCLQNNLLEAISEKFDEEISVTTDKKIMHEFLDEIIELLNQSYWRQIPGNECNVPKMKQLIDDVDACHMLTVGDKVVGFVRIHSDGDVGYVSDMVIDHSRGEDGQPLYRGKGLGTLLFQHLYEHSILGKLKTVVLTTASQGDGKNAAPLLYRKFEFKHSHSELNLKNDAQDDTDYNDLGDSVIYMRNMKKLEPKKKPPVEKDKTVQGVEVQSSSEFSAKGQAFK